MITAFDAEHETFQLPGGQTLSLTAEDVRRVYGLPNGHIAVNQTASPSLKKAFASQKYGLTISRTGFVACTNLTQRLSEYEGSSKLFATMYILLALGTLLNPKNSEKIHLHAYATALHDISRVADYDWAGHVRGQLILALKETKRKMAGDAQNLWPEGNLHLLLVGAVIQCVE